ncbi:uncharacterized protein LOC108021932 [Drosophila biarmipes]|uniref:uncharacterized protein LOC108021932 n=1 Tax=Drosophila biarmipes TaxID=125945 RepID=UPI0007E7925E|nr:uncharacterized protein LOC108021932 [Drosophila biarmipes]
MAFNPFKIHELEDISHLPIRCPLENCMDMVAPMDLLFHLKAHHRLHTPGDTYLHLAFEAERCLLTFDPSQLPSRKTICLGVLLFGGQRGSVGQLPAIRGICCSNRLPPISGLDALGDFLPVMILVRKSSFLEWFLLDRNTKPDLDVPPKWEHHELSDPGSQDWVKKEESEINNHPENVESSQFPPSFSPEDQEPAEEGEDIRDLAMYTIWTQGVPCTLPLHVTMTAFDRILSEGRSALRRVANTGRVYPEICGKELPKDRNSMTLSQREIDKLCGTQHHVQLELILSERCQKPTGCF